MTDHDAIAAAVLKWVAGWHTSPEKPFKVAQVADLYVRDGRLFSYDFGRPHNGVEGWDAAARYYQGFMDIPARWDLEAGGDLRVTVRDAIAWATVSLRGRGEMPNGDAIDMPEARVTLIFERQQDGNWLILHEHGSTALPFPDEATTQLLLQV